METGVMTSPPALGAPYHTDPGKSQCGLLSKFIASKMDFDVRILLRTFGKIMDYLLNAFDAGIYFQGEEGQFRSKAERRQALELFCYPIGINFAPSKKANMPIEAFKFVQARAFLKNSRLDEYRFS